MPARFAVLKLEYWPAPPIEAGVGEMGEMGKWGPVCVAGGLHAMWRTEECPNEEIIEVALRPSNKCSIVQFSEP